MGDSEFVFAFEAAAIPLERWTHRDHVRIAFLYLRDLAFADALNRLRSGIKALNRANGVRDTPTSGYHETVTVAWARMVAAAIEQRSPTQDFAAFAHANPELLRKEALRAHYTKNRILSPEARTSFVEPDLTPLPRSEARELEQEPGAKNRVLD